MHLNSALLTLVIVGVAATAPGASAETLQDALAVAYQTNPTIQAERARLRATREAKTQAWAGALPQVSAQATYDKLDTTQTSAASSIFDQSTKLDQISGGFTAEQPVFTGFRNYNAIKQAGARVRAGGAQLAAVEQQVMRDVATAYFDVVRDMAVYGLNRNNVEVLFKQREQAALRFEVGEVTRTDVAQAEARLSGARAQLTAAQASLAVSRSKYAALVGAMPGTLEPAPTLPDLPETLEAAKALAEVYAPPIIAAREREQASSRQIKIARGALLPSVSLTGSYQYNEEPNTFIDNIESYSYGARASMPIFQGGLNYSRIREAKALNDSDRQRIEEARRNAVADVTAAWEQLQAARATIESARAQVDANTLALEGVRQEALVGARTTLDVLDAEQELLNAEVALATAERDEQAAAYGLLAAAGVLTPEAVGIDNLAGIPEQNYEDTGLLGLFRR
ncbi:MAG: TolC family outer membrane protein [Parvularculaceae bacterium]